MDNSALISLNDLTLVLSGKTVLENINLEVGQNEVISFIGKNGSGKTVLLKTAAGIYQPAMGSLSLFGSQIDKLSRHELQQKMIQTGYVFQKSGLFDSMTVMENVLFGLSRFSGKPVKDFFDKGIHLLELTGLKGVENKYPAQLSGGMQKRASIARAIAMDPKVLFLDDPTAGLDPVLSDAIADLILDLKNNLQSAVLVATHDLKVAQKISSRIIVMDRGKIATETKASDFATSDNKYIVQFRTMALEGPVSVIDE